MSFTGNMEKGIKPEGKESLGGNGQGEKHIIRA
jgi:hypothetical protein